MLTFYLKTMKLNNNWVLSFRKEGKKKVKIVTPYFIETTGQSRGIIRFKRNISLIN